MPASALDPVSLVHGVFFARKNWPWQPRIARAVTSFIEASGVQPGGQRRRQAGRGHQRGQGAARPPRATGRSRTHRVEYTAATITAYFTVDHAQFRSYGLSEPATALLEALADFEIAHPARPRAAAAHPVRPAWSPKSAASGRTRRAAAARIAKLAADCAGELGPVTEVTWSGRAKARVSDVPHARDPVPARPLPRQPLGPGVNEGASEWPPSPWRLLRALIATWHTRWPDLPAEAFDGLLGALGDPPGLPDPATPGPVTPGTTCPDLDHRKGETGHTDLTLDPFLSLRRDGTTPAEPAELLVRWDADLDAGQRSVLAKLAELLPYLGRAESVCEARLLDEDPVPDETWWRPGAQGARTTRLLAPARPVSRAALEVTTVQVRKMRRTLPPGTVWVSYAAAGEEAVPATAASSGQAGGRGAVRRDVAGTGQADPRDPARRRGARGGGAEVPRRSSPGTSSATAARRPITSTPTGFR